LFYPHLYLRAKIGTYLIGFTIVRGLVIVYFNEKLKNQN
jgi:hypothetical protein